MTHEAMAKLLHAIIAAGAGIVIGWTSTALTLGGRVDAIERALQRIEARMELQARSDRSAQK